MDYLEKLSEKADVRLLAERREMAHKMYRMELAVAREEGEANGKVENQRALLLRLLQSKDIRLTEDQQAKIASCSDLSLLDQWFDQALAAASVEDIDI